jgi:hypothetical protein
VTFYGDLQTTADDLLADKGQTITLTRETGESYNITTGAVTGGTNQSQSCYGAVFSPLKNRDDELFVDDRLTNRIKRKVLLSPKNTDGTALDFDPAPGMTCTIGGVDYFVEVVRETNPAGTAVLWTMGVSR